MPIIIAYIIKKELGVFLRVPGNDQQKTDLVNTLVASYENNFGLRDVYINFFVDFRYDLGKQIKVTNLHCPN